MPLRSIGLESKVRGAGTHWGWGGAGGAGEPGRSRPLCLRSLPGDKKSSPPHAAAAKSQFSLRRRQALRGKSSPVLKKTPGRGPPQVTRHRLCSLPPSRAHLPSKEGTMGSGLGEAARDRPRPHLSRACGGSARRLGSTSASRLVPWGRGPRALGLAGSGWPVLGAPGRQTGGSPSSTSLPPWRSSRVPLGRRSGKVGERVAAAPA